MRWLLSLLAILFLVAPVYGQAKYQSWCMQGNQQVVMQGQNSTTRVQRSFPVCTITVFNAGTTQVAQIFSDVSRTPLANPFQNQSQNTGQFFFYANNGRYDIQIAATGLTTFKLSDVILNDLTGGGGGGNPACLLTTLAPTLIQPCIDASGGWAFPQWWGAISNGAADTGAAINLAIQYCGGTNGGTWLVPRCNVRLTAGYWWVTTPIRMYSATLMKPIAGLQLCGNGKYSTILDYSGPANSSAIRMIGWGQRVCDIQLNANTGGSGWLDGIQYDGDPAIGVSSAGRIADVMIECGGMPGNGISLGRGRRQADQAVIDHAWINGCSSGYGVVSMDPNAISNTLISPSIHYCWVGVGSDPNVTPGGILSVVSGEFDYDDINFQVSPGTALTITGVRTEGSKRTIDSAVGGYPQPISFLNYTVSSTYWQDSIVLGNRPPRPATNGTSVDFTHVVLSQPNSVTWGDFIVIVGAGPGGTDLHTHIASMTDPTHVVLDVAGVDTAVTNAAVTLDTSVPQHNFFLRGGGPYIISGAFMNSTQNEMSFIAPQGSMILDGVGFATAFANPNPLNVGPTDPSLLHVNWRSVWTNSDPTNLMSDRINALDIQTTTTACTTAATAGATCTTSIPHNFGAINNETFCTLRNAPSVQTGIPIILSVVPVDANNSTVTIGTYNGQAAGGGTLACFTNFQF